MRLRSSAIQCLGFPSGEELWGGGAGLGEETGPTPLSGPLSRLRPSRDYLSPCDPTRHPSTFFLLPPFFFSYFSQLEPSISYLSSFPFLSCAILCAERCCLPFAPFDPSCKTDTSFRIRVFLLFPGGSNYPFFLSSHSFDIYCGLEPHYNYSHSLNSSPPRPSTSAHHSTCFPSTFSSPCSARWRPKHPSSGGTRPSLRRFLVGKTLGVTSETLAAVEATGETTVCGKPSYVMSMREHASNTYYRRWPGREWRKWRRSGGQWPR